MSRPHAASPWWNIVDRCTRGDGAALARERASCNSVYGLAHVLKNSCFRKCSSTSASTASPTSPCFIHAIRVDKILFASGIIGVMYCIDAQIRNDFDDLKRYDAVSILCAARKRDAYQGCARSFRAWTGRRKVIAADRDADTNRRRINEISRKPFGRIFSKIKE